MFLEPSVSDELVEMTPPTARVLALQERKRFVIVLILLFALVSLCVVAVSQLGQTITAQYPPGAISFLPQVF